MSRKRTKQYLMLLMVVGLVSIAAGGGGTFASFSAETTNAGNYFATGTLVLNNNGGTQTCTSAVDAVNNHSVGTDCDTLFNITNTSVADPHAYLTNATLLAGATTVLLAAPGVQGAAIDKGDSITIHDATNGNETLTTSARVDIGATSIPVTGATATDHIAKAFVTDDSGVYYAKLTLTNAGSIDAQGISFKSAQAAGCTTTDQEPTGTLTSALVKTTSYGSLSLNVSGGSPTVASGNSIYHAGQPIVVSNGTDAQTFIVTADTPVPNTGLVTVNVTSDKANAAYTVGGGTTVSGPDFSTPSGGDLCTTLKFGIIETDSTFSDTAALGCAFGTATQTANLGCLLNSVTGITAIPSSLTRLVLASGSVGNTAGELDHGQSRYFLLALKLPSYAAFTNGDQNKATTAFDLTWHIDQV